MAVAPDVPADRAGNDLFRSVVDVIIPAWNSAGTIERAIRSVMDEHCVHQVIVVDDGSTDDTAGRARALAAGNPRVRVIGDRHNRGPSAARNQALEIATAPWVALLDSDDAMRPGRLATLLSAGADLDFIADNIELRLADAPEDAPGKRLFDLQSCWSDLDFRRFVQGNIGRRGFARQELGFLKPLMRRAFLDRFSLRYDETVRLGEDYLLYARALALGARFRLVQSCGYLATMRADSLSGCHTRQDLHALRTADRALLALPLLSEADRAAVRAHLRHLDCKIQWLDMIEAVKSRNPLRIAKGFSSSPPVAAFVGFKLAEECARRLGLLQPARLQ